MQSRSKTKQDQHRFEAIMQIGCVVCKKYKGIYTPPQIHHIDGKTKKGAHQKTIGLCYWHHMADQQNPPSDQYVSRHPRKKAFEAEYETEQELLEYQNQLISNRE